MVEVIDLIETVPDSVIGRTFPFPHTHLVLKANLANNLFLFRQKFHFYGRIVSGVLILETELFNLTNFILTWSNSVRDWYGIVAIILFIIYIVFSKYNKW